jgi:hypothetical protein
MPMPRKQRLFGVDELLTFSNPRVACRVPTRTTQKAKSPTV